MVSRPVRRFRRVSTLALLAAVAVALLALAPAQAAAAPSPTACENRTNTTYGTLLECVTLEGVRAHQAAFQAIADANGGTRAAGTSGYDASVDYVVDTLEAALWCVGRAADFEEAIVAAVNLGGDTDTIGAVAGQVAGAVFGASAIPRRWRERLYAARRIEEMALELHRRGDATGASFARG